MKWLGQHIIDLIARFRSDVYLEDLATTTETSVLVVDSDGLVSKSTSVGGDLTSIVAGTGLSGTSLTGPIPTLNVDAAQTGITSLGTLSSLTVGTTGKINFRDGNSFINSPDANDLEIAATDITLDAAGQIYFEAATARFVSSDANDPLVIIQGEADDATGPRLRFNKKRGADGEALDSCGILQWQSYNDGTPSTQLYGQIETTIHDASAGEESGQLEIGVANEDGGMGTGLKLVGGSADNEVDVTIGLGASSVTTVAGSITMSGTGSPVAAMTNAGLLSVAGQTNITSLGTLTALTVDNISINEDRITASGDLEIVATGNDISVDTDNFVISSSTSQKPFLELKNTTSNNKSSILQFTKDKGAAGADNDTIGIINFVGDDSSQTQTFFAQITGGVSEADNTDEAGKLTLSVAASDGTNTLLKPGLLLEGEHATGSEVDVTIANGAASTTTVAGTLTMGSTAAMTNAGLLSVANQSNITGVGTISSGVWQGTTIKTAYIGDDQVTEDKLADTLLAEIDANTAKVTNVATNLTATTHASQITINSSDGTNVIVAEASGSIAGVMSVTHHDKLDAIEASATADQSKSDIDGLAITTVGTIDTGVWNGTAIASDQQKHLMHYQVQGYSAGSTNYLIPKNVATNTAPFAHTIDIGSDGTTAKSVTVWMRTGGHVMPNACTLKRFTGWTAAAGGASQTVALFRVRLEDDVDSDPSAVLLQEVTYTASGNQTANLFNVTEASDGQSLALAAGDIIFSAIKGGSNPVYFNGTFEVEF